MRDDRDFTRELRPPYRQASRRSELFGGLLLIAAGILIGFIAGVLWGAP